MSVLDKERTAIKNLLKEVCLFRNLPERHLDLLSSDFSTINIKRGKPVFLQTDQNTELYIILKGKATVNLLSDKGEEFILNELKEGDFFGELSFIDGKPRTATVVAAEDLTLAVLKRESLINAIKQEPMIAIKLLETTVQRFRQAAQREEHFVFLDVRERLSRYFTSLIKAEGQMTSCNYRIMKRSQKELASRIGASRESISKALKEMVQKKEIREKGDFLLITPKLYKNFIDTPFINTGVLGKVSSPNSVKELSQNNPGKDKIASLPLSMTMKEGKHTP